MIRKHGLRILDAIQLACATQARLSIDSLLQFLSSEEILLKIAAAEGFTIDYPNLHP